MKNTDNFREKTGICYSMPSREFDWSYNYTDLLIIVTQWLEVEKGIINKEAAEYLTEALFESLTTESPEDWLEELTEEDEEMKEVWEIVNN